MKTPAQDAAVKQTTIIEPSRGWSAIGVKELWERRELLYFLLVREIQGTHRQTALGLSWVFLRPVIHMVLLTLVFGRVVRVPSDGVPYPVFALSALLPWGLFSNAVIRSSRSLVDNLPLISKVYFPRLVIPLAGASAGVIDFIASSTVVVAMLLYYGMPLRLEMAVLPLLLVLTLAFSLGVGLWLATLSVKYRDVSFAISFLLQALLYASPVIYPLSMVPDRARFLYQLNPMANLIQAFRWALVGTDPVAARDLALTCIAIGVLLISGAYFFRRTERAVVDIL